MPTIFIVLAIVMSLAAFVVFFLVFRQIRKEWKKERDLASKPPDSNASSKADH